MERAYIVRELVEIRERSDRLIEALMGDEPDASACVHPPECIVDESTMDDDGELYVCTKCGRSQSVPFHHNHDEG